MRAGDSVGEPETEIGQYPEYFYKCVSVNVGHYIKEQWNYWNCELGYVQNCIFWTGPIVCLIRLIYGW